MKENPRFPSFPHGMQERRRSPGCQPRRERGRRTGSWSPPALPRSTARTAWGPGGAPAPSTAAGAKAASRRPRAASPALCRPTSTQRGGGRAAVGARSTEFAGWVPTGCRVTPSSRQEQEVYILRGIYVYIRGHKAHLRYRISSPFHKVFFSKRFSFLIQRRLNCGSRTPEGLQLIRASPDHSPPGRRG